MENTLQTIEEAQAAGYGITRDQALRLTGWSKAKLDRRKHEVGFVLVKGKTKPTPFFNEAALLQAAGIIEGIPEPEQTQALMRKPQESLKKVSRLSQAQNVTSGGNDLLIIPHKLILNLKDVSLLTGFSVGFLRFIAKQSSLFYKFNGWKISKADLLKMVQDRGYIEHFWSEFTKKDR